MLATLKEFDALSEKIKTAIINVTQTNFAKVTADNITRVLYVLAEASSYGYDKLQIAQAEIAMQVSLSENRISELLKLAKKAGLIGIDMICRCGDIRNEYTLLDNPIVNSIKKIIFKSQESDNKESINKAIEQAMSFYKAKGEQDYILEAVKNRMENMSIKKASGVFNYFRKTLKSVKYQAIESTEPTTTTTYKNSNSTKGTFNNFEQREFDTEAEAQLLGKAPAESIDEDELKKKLKEIRKSIK